MQSANFKWFILLGVMFVLLTLWFIIAEIEVSIERGDVGGGDEVRSV